MAVAIMVIAMTMKVYTYIIHWKPWKNTMIAYTITWLYVKLVCLIAGGRSENLSVTFSLRARCDENLQWLPMCIVLCIHFCWVPW